MLSVLGRTWNLCWRSWAALGAYVGDLGPLLEPMLAVLGRSWSLCWQSEAGLGIYAGGPGEAGNAGKLRTLGSSEGPDLPEGPVRIFSVDIHIRTYVLLYLPACLYVVLFPFCVC